MVSSPYALRMPLGYDIYQDIGLLYIRGQGVTTQRERMTAMLAWLREPQYENCTDALIDFTDVTAAPSSDDKSTRRRLLPNV